MPATIPSKSPLPIYKLIFFNRGPNGYFWIRLRYKSDLWSAKNVVKRAFRSKLSSCSCQCTDIMMHVAVGFDTRWTPVWKKVCVCLCVASSCFCRRVSNCWKAAKGPFIAGLFSVHAASGGFFYTINKILITIAFQSVSLVVDH